MKKKILALVIVGTLVVGGVVGAMVATYISQIENHAESEKNRLAALYSQKVNDGKNEANVDLQAHTDAEKQRISAEMEDYVMQRASEQVNEYTEDGRDEITQAADEAIDELKAYVDGLAE